MQLFFKEANITNINDMESETFSKGQKFADSIAQLVGSWRFIIIQTIVFGIWVIFNFIAYFEHWDPYPFILLNLILSTQAAYTAPIIMMSQNRQVARDRLEAHNDFLINKKAESEIRDILNKLELQNTMLQKLQTTVDSINKKS